MKIRNKRWAPWIGAAVFLGACGGGGGDTAIGGGGVGAPPPTSGGRTLSGVITMAETSAVDSDTNDVNQGNYRPNNNAASAQAIDAPVLVVGSVNKAATGPQGRNRAAGDEDDIYKITLGTDQIVELEFSASPSSSDIDLYLVSEDRQTVGESIGEDTRFECIRVTTPGSYFLIVNAFRSASIYNLRIGAPGSGGTCGNVTQPASFEPGQVVALANATGQAKGPTAAEVNRKAGVERIAGGPGPELLRLPADARGRISGLKALSGEDSGAGSGAVGDFESVATLRYAKALRASGAYRYAQPNHLMQRHDLTGNFPPNDRNYSLQRWHYEQINLPAAMARIHALANKPVQRPIVAVIDDGVMLDHPDLRPQLVGPGRSFISVNAQGDGNSASGDNPARPSDQPVFHGTHVSGTIAAQTFDATGGAGVAPMAQIMPLRVFTPAGQGATTFDIVQAMLYASGLPNGSNLLPPRRADVINMSLGGDVPCGAAYQDTIDKARAAGVVVVVSAGNSGQNDRGRRVAVGSPANCRGAVAVSATDARKSVTFYSNTGAALTVAAPGGDSSQSTTGNGASDSIFSDVGAFDGSTRIPSFGGMMGTSMAAPHVSGVMALMKYLNPALTPAQIDGLFASGQLTDDLGAAGKDQDFGWGLVNAAKAVEAALASAGTTPPPAPAGSVIASPSTIDFGSSQVTAVLELLPSGQTAERVVSVTSDTPAVAIEATAVDATTRLGRYTLRVDRNAIAATGTSFPKLTVTLAPARTFVVQLTVTKPGANTAGRLPDLGPMYVLLINPDTGTARTVLATWANGRYTWSASGYTSSRVSILAGGDTDNDDIICQRGEPCGGYPVLGPSGDPVALDLTGDRTDLDFRVAPLSGISAQSIGGPEPGRARTTVGVAR